MSIWSDLWADAGNGDGVDISKLNILTVRPGATVVEGKVYPDIISAQDYAVTQVPSATNPFKIRGSRAITSSEDITVKSWIQIESFILTGNITSDVELTPPSFFEEGLITDCELLGDIGSAGKIIALSKCLVSGGTAIANSIIAVIRDSEIADGNFSSAGFYFVANSTINGGIFGLAFVAEFSSIAIGSFSGGQISKSILELDLTIANTKTMEMYDCTYNANAKTITIESGGILNCENLTGKNLIINIEPGGILNSWNISKRITVNNFGTHNDL